MDTSEKSAGDDITEDVYFEIAGMLDPVHAALFTIFKKELLADQVRRDAYDQVDQLWEKAREDMFGFLFSIFESFGSKRQDVLQVRKALHEDNKKQFLP